MGMRIFHTADLHLGMKFTRGYPEEVQQSLIQARFDTLCSMVERANKEGSEVFVIAGGKDKGADFGEFGDAIAEHAAGAFFIGETRERIAEAIAGRVPTMACATLEKAVRGAFAAAQPGATVVLLPACSSFDMFSDYAARGDAFAGIVAELMREEGGSG